MSTFLTIAVIVLFFVVIFQIAKASEYVAILKGEDNSRRQNNKINGFMMVVFLLLGLIGVWYCNDLYYDKTLLPHPAASDHGEKVDSMLWITLWITGITFIITQVLLFWFSFRYQESKTRKVYFLAHNNKLELLWTVVPAIALTVLVVIGLKNWFKFTSEAPANSQVVEVTGKQFNWIYRYPGKDGVLGKRYYKEINDEKGNTLGQLWDDKNNFDDVVSTEALYIVKGRPVKLIIGSRDVIHDVGLSHFRLKIDAVPGIPTTMWFTPKYTTKEMQEITGNPNFQYELSCDQMCGNSHYSMRGIVKVVTQPEYDEWMVKQKPTYLSTHPELDPANQNKPASADTTKGATAKLEARP
ncbi:MAG: cytochrome c oxidase subunit [Chitinophagaceae bacterium]|nr:cytochrome c oxidase subunit [Chitinophagaceae bacterium]